MKNITDTVARYVDGTATPSDVCNAVLAELAADPSADTVRRALAIVPDDLHPDACAYLYDVGVSDDVPLRIASRCGHEERPMGPSMPTPETGAAINAWWNS